MENCQAARLSARVYVAHISVTSREFNELRAASAPRSSAISIVRSSDHKRIAPRALRHENRSGRLSFIIAVRAAFAQATTGPDGERHESRSARPSARSSRWKPEDGPSRSRRWTPRVSRSTCYVHVRRPNRADLTDSRSRRFRREAIPSSQPSLPGAGSAGLRRSRSDSGEGHLADDSRVEITPERGTVRRHDADAHGQSHSRRRIASGVDDRGGRARTRRSPRSTGSATSPRSKPALSRSRQRWTGRGRSATPSPRTRWRPSK